MKKPFLAIALGLSLFLCRPTLILAVTPAKSAVSLPTVTPTPSLAVRVEYSLPYPGILPDHPLYWLKRIRDAILDKLIVEPARRIEFQILQADKRLAMGIMLTEQGKAALGEQVISRAEVYLEQAVGGLRQLKEKKFSVEGYLLEKLTKAVQKHNEVVGELLVKAGQNQQPGLRQSLERVQALISELEKHK